jgi:hypothetical protein
MLSCFWDRSQQVRDGPRVDGCCRGVTEERFSPALQCKVSRIKLLNESGCICGTGCCAVYHTTVGVVCCS